MYLYARAESWISPLRTFIRTSCRISPLRGKAENHTKQNLVSIILSFWIEIWWVLWEVFLLPLTSFSGCKTTECFKSWTSSSLFSSSKFPGSFLSILWLSGAMLSPFWLTKADFLLSFHFFYTGFCVASHRVVLEPSRA